MYRMQIQEKVHQKLTIQKQIDSNSEQERRCGQQLVSLTETLENFRSVGLLCGICGVVVRDWDSVCSVLAALFVL